MNVLRAQVGRADAHPGALQLRDGAVQSRLRAGPDNAVVCTHTRTTELHEPLADLAMCNGLNPRNSLPFGRDIGGDMQSERGEAFS